LPQQLANLLAIDGLCGTLEPIKWSEPVVVSCIRICAVVQQERDRFREAGLRSVVKRGRATAVVVLADQAPIINPCAVAQQRGNVVRVVFAALVTRARSADPFARATDGCAGSREQARQLRVEHPAASTDR